MYQSRWAPQAQSREDDPKSSTHQSTSSLSAAAPSFSPAPPPPDVSSSDYFTPNGPVQDNLFDDDVTPVDGSMRVRSEDDLFSDDFEPVQQPVADQSVPPATRGRADRSRGDRSHGRDRVRGRGRGVVGRSRGGVFSNGQSQSVQHNAQTDEPQQTGAPDDAPTGPKKESTGSVRGDRQGTGGLRKPKLTEEELAAKMARIQIKNASLTEAHARAEADAASFAQREEQAKLQATQKQKEERRDRQQMMGERERNRMRKLKAMEGREWDAEKNEDDFSKGGRHDKKGGFVGDKEDYTDGREYLYKEPRGGQRGTRGTGRGSRPSEQATPGQDDFPALPPANRKATTSQQSKEVASATPGKSWADQVESSNPS